MTETDIARWAAGASIDLPHFEERTDPRLLYLLGMDEDKLIALLDTHRLAHCFIHRYQQERPAWCSKSLLGRILHLCQQTEIHLRHQIAALHEIHAALDPTNRPLIPIKGFCTYVLTGQPQQMRRSNDLDLFAPDPHALCTTLERLGYACKPKEPGTHELAQLTRGHIVLEVHQHQAILRYPPGVASADLDPRHHPGGWWQNFADMPVRKMGYEDLLPHSLVSALPQMQAWRVPTPTLAAFLLCTHLFRHYTYLPLACGLLPLKLVEFAELVVLTRHPQFDAPTFLGLCAQFDAQDSLACVEYLAQRFLGFPVLPVPPGRKARQTGYPRWICGWKCWMNAPEQGELLPSDPVFAIDHLGANRIEASCHEPAPCYSVGVPGSGRQLTRFLIHSPAQETLPLELSVLWGARSLVVSLRLLLPLPADPDYYEIVLRGSPSFLGRSASPIPYWVTLSRQGVEAGPDLEVEVSVQEPESRVRMRLAWEGMEAGLRGCASLPLLLAVIWRQQSGSPFSTYHTVLLLPLRISRQA